MRKVSVVLAACLLLAFSLTAQKSDAATAKLPVGSWHGKLDVGVVKLRLVLHVKDEAGALQAELDSPDQGAKGIPVDAVSFEGGVLKFTIEGLRASYEGSWNEDAGEFRGTFTQGRDFPLVLVRVEGELEAPKRPQNPKPPFPYTVEEVSYSHDPAGDTVESFRVADAAAAKEGEARVRLAATLTLPKTEGPHPAVVLISGSGAQDRDESLLGHKPFLVLADSLTRRGVAVLRFDDRGTARSTGDHAAATSRDFAKDAHAGVLYLQSRKEIDKDKIGLMGHSEGGLIAPMVAAKSDAVAFVVLLAGPGVTGDEIILLQSRLIGKAMGATDEQLDVGGNYSRQIFDVIRAGGSAADVRAKVEKILHDSYDEMPPEAREGTSSKEQFVAQTAAPVLTPWFQFFVGYDPAPTLTKVKCPVLALNGALDLQVDADQNIPPIKAALANNPDVTAVVLDGLNHLFQNCKTGATSEYAQIEETFDPKALELIGDWIAERFL